MIIISHRGNLNGPSTESENNISQIEYCLKMGYDVEIDLRYIASEKQFYLGHDAPVENVSLSWINDRKDRLWIHCKTLDTLDFFSRIQNGFTYFWHQNDNYTLTSNNIIWAYPGMPITSQAIILLPELKKDIDWKLLKASSCFGICTDYPTKLN